MADFALVVDADPTRRAQFVRDVRMRVAPAAGLVTGGVEDGSFQTMWRIAPGAPVSSVADARGCAVIWGEPVDSAGAAVPAERFARTAAEGCTPPLCDGYYAAAACAGDRTVVCGDLLGLFPLYYAYTSDVLVVSSDARSVCLHRLFPPVMDRDAVVGALLFDCLVDDRSCFRGVRRLSPGRALVWVRGEGARECPHYSLPTSDRTCDLTFDEQVQLLDGAVAAAVSRQTPDGQQHAVLLSGGRDSRLLAGYLHERHGGATMVTLGLPGDHDVRLARRVADTLDAPHIVTTPRPLDMPRLAEHHARFDNLATGFSSPHLWGVIEPLRSTATRVMTGHMLDFTLGGNSFRLPGSPHYVIPFEPLLPELNKRGVAVDVLRRMLYAADRERVDAAVECVRTRYEACTPAHEQCWRHQLATFERLRVGSVPWRLSFGAWPVVPALDQRLLELTASLSLEVLHRRRAQDALLMTRFPQLARLPLVERNAGFRPPLLSSLRDRVRYRRRTPRVHRGWRRLLPERRYNWRMYDFNSAEWRAVRHHAEPERHRLADLFDMDLLDSYLPLPDVTVPRSTFFSSMGRKLVVGLMLWMRVHDL